MFPDDFCGVVVIRFQICIFDILNTAGFALEEVGRWL